MMETDHTQRKIEIKTPDGTKDIDCDVELVDIIKWLNDNEFYTRYSCQGDGNVRGYINFQPDIDLNGNRLLILKRRVIEFLFPNHCVFTLTWALKNMADARNVFSDNLLSYPLISCLTVNIYKTFEQYALEYRAIDAYEVTKNIERKILHGKQIKKQ